MHTAIASRIHGNGLIIFLKKNPVGSQNSKHGNNPPNSCTFTLEKKPFDVAN